MTQEPSEAERARSGPSRGALRGLGALSPALDIGRASCERMLAATTERLARIHRVQVERDRWPDFAAFDASRYSLALRREAARQWARRACAEHGSIHQFSAVMHGLCEARVGLELLGALARLITDEVRHAELCAAMAVALLPEGGEPELFAWPTPDAPWHDAPGPEQPQALLAWAADAILIACCLGETISRPMYEALIVVTTDPVAEQVVRQILRDEHLHAAFGWDALALLLPALEPAGRAQVQERLRRALGGFEATTACGYTIDEVAGRAITVERGEAANLGLLTSEQYAMIFFATIEQEVIPALHALGLDPAAAWAGRPGRAAP